MALFCANRLAIGTANWGKPYGLSGKQVDKSEQKDILDYCQCAGIDMIETSTVYGTFLDAFSSYFKKVIKYQPAGLYGMESVLRMWPYCLMAHGGEFWDVMMRPLKDCDKSHIRKYGASIYDAYETNQLPMSQVGVLEVPYSLFDRRLERYFPQWKRDGIEIHVRSIFLQGRILEKASPQDCISFCLMNPYVDRVIIGVDSLKQLEDNLRPFHRMNALEVTDEKILDPRQW